jgi:hypothetical protein
VPGGKRSERVSRRDLEVLEFVARYGIVTRGAMAMWAGTRRAATLGRERRLRLAGYLLARPTYESDGPLLVCTRRGLAVTGRAHLGSPRFSDTRARHTAAVGRIGAELERAGERVLSEREIVWRERLEGDRVFSAGLENGRYHRADLIRMGDVVEAIEVELTPKAPRRLDEILEAWRGAIIWEKVGRVVYRCSPEALRYLTRAVDRVEAREFVRLNPL